MPGRDPSQGRVRALCVNGFICTQPDAETLGWVTDTGCRARAG